MARCLRDTGCLVIRDPRVNARDNQVFLDLMERYFEQPHEVKLQDARPAFHYQASLASDHIPYCLLDPLNNALLQEDYEELKPC